MDVQAIIGDMQRFSQCGQTRYWEGKKFYRFVCGSCNIYTISTNEITSAIIFYLSRLPSKRRSANKVNWRIPVYWYLRENVREFCVECSKINFSFVNSYHSAYNVILLLPPRVVRICEIDLYCNFSCSDSFPEVLGYFASFCWHSSKVIGAPGFLNYTVVQFERT